MQFSMITVAAYMEGLFCYVAGTTLGTLGVALLQTGSLCQVEWPDIRKLLTSDGYVAQRKK